MSDLSPRSGPKRTLSRRRRMTESETHCGHRKHLRDLPIGLLVTDRAMEGVVSSLHCMNDPQPEGHMASYIGRRKFLATLGGAAAAWPLTARAQQPGKLPTIGFFGPSTPSAVRRRTDAFTRRLGELGWIEGRTVAIQYRWAMGRTERFAEIAAELVR